MQLRDTMGRENERLAVDIIKDLSLDERLEFRIAAAVLLIIIVLVGAQTWTHFRMRHLLKKQEEDRLYIREMGESFARVIDMKDTGGGSTEDIDNIHKQMTSSD